MKTVTHVSGSGEESRVTRYPTLKWPRAARLAPQSDDDHQGHRRDREVLLRRQRFDMIGTVLLNHWDDRTGIPLSALPGVFRIHPEHQEHIFELSNGIRVREKLFVLSGVPNGRKSIHRPATTISNCITGQKRPSRSARTPSRSCAATRRTILRRGTARNTAQSWRGTKRTRSWLECSVCVEPTSYEVTTDNGR